MWNLATFCHSHYNRLRIMAIAWPRKERKVGDGMENAPQYVIEMLHITKEFPGIRANDDITLQLRKGEIHALLGENGSRR